ncbi:MAG TPA: serine/threonine-protein kinase [Gemmatimonadales bacterium]|nr:serine/threonine-protein kinase [Gemmatimonadales bacterium]
MVVAAGLLTQAKMALAERYALERELGSGGMATVFLAQDRRYERAVAVKVLRPDVAAAIGAERFLREIRITARLNHPHILPLLDSGDAAGLLYYVMPYVGGGSLRTRLCPGGTLTPDQAVDVVRQVAAALDHAHQHGVIHRDIKPENVLFSDGHAFVADFGIARAFTAAEAGGLTRSGFPVGTPGYMSPEQATGGVVPDPRTDVFGLGCVAYEMLVGATPELWPVGDAVRLGRFEDASAGHRARLDALPGRVEQVLVRALAVRPAERFATPGALAEALATASSGGPAVPDAQVGEIIRRAAEMQAAAATEDGGLTMGGVEQVAAQVGIPPALVRQAAGEVLPAPAAPRPGLPVARRKVFPDLIVVERVVPRIPESAYEAIIQEIQTTLGMAGLAAAVGRTFSWAGSPGSGTTRDVRVTLAPDGDHTRIHIEEHLALRGGAMAGPPVGAILGMSFAAIAASLLGGPEAAGLFGLLGGFLGAAGGVRFVLVTQEMQRRPQLEQLARRLADRGGGRDGSP